MAEVVNDTFLVVWQKPRKYSGEGEGEVATWLWGIAIRTLLHRLRPRKSVFERLVQSRAEHVPSAEEAVLLGVEHGDVGMALQRLSPELLAVVQATVLDGLTTREAAACWTAPPHAPTLGRDRRQRQLSGLRLNHTLGTVDANAVHHRRTFAARRATARQS